jgi:uncharacterized protein
MEHEVRIHEFTPMMDLTGAKVVDGFPSVGLVSTIAANYLIDMLRLKQIGVIDGDHFPSLAVVHNGEPLAPARIYGGERPVEGTSKKERIVVFVSEFQPAPALIRPIAEAMLNWAKKKGADYLISPEGLVLEGPATEDDVVEVFGIGSTEKVQQLLKANKVPPFTRGIITGVSGILLTLGKRERFDVLSILAEAHANYPDARSAAVVIDTIAKLLGIKVDVAPLYREAEGFEKQIKQLQQQAQAKQRRSQTAQPSMYG